MLFRIAGGPSSLPFRNLFFSLNFERISVFSPHLRKSYYLPLCPLFTFSS